MQAVLFDTSVYITALRRGDLAIVTRRSFGPDTPIWLSAVVLEELYAGAQTQDYGVLEDLQEDFQRVGRLVVPNLDDWTETGRLLSKLAREYGYEQIGRGRLTNDALMAMSAARLGLTLLTANQRDFARLAEFRPFQWKAVQVSHPRLS